MNGIASLGVSLPGASVSEAAEARAKTGDLAVLFVHGMGSQDSTFYLPLLMNLKRELGEFPKLHWMTAWWAPILESRERALWQDMRPGLAWRPLRKFLLSSVADALAYQPTPREKGFYDRLGQEFDAALTSLALMCGPDTPLAVISHSLGCIMAGDYFYDLQSNKRTLRDNATSLELGRTLRWFITLGNPLPLWSLRHPEFDRPIMVPSRGTRGDWVNIYDRYDPLAWPVQRLNSAHSVAAVDHEVRVREGFLGRLPWVHTGYWKSRAVARAIARLLREPV